VGVSARESWGGTVLEAEEGLDFLGEGELADVAEFAGIEHDAAADGAGVVADVGLVEIGDEDEL